jgi:cytoskeletal protein CcmA (bactofilin family)
MLKMHKNEQSGYDSSARPASRMFPSQEKRSSSTTVIGENIAIEGTIRAHENMIIEGNMKGKIELAHNQITIGPSGQVEADIVAQDIVISGKMTGNVTAHGKVEITKEADFNGDIKTNRISVEDGAYIKASIEMNRDQNREAAPAKKAPIEAIKVSEKEEKNEEAKAETTKSEIKK